MRWRWVDDDLWYAEGYVDGQLCSLIITKRKNGGWRIIVTSGQLGRVIRWYNGNSDAELKAYANTIVERWA